MRSAGWKPCSLILAVAMALSCSPAFASKVQVENVRVEKDYSNSWTVAGEVRNLEDHPIKGYVKVKFVNSRGDIVYTSASPVNDEDPLSPGQAGPFACHHDPSKFDGVVRFEVIFIDE